MECFQQFLDCLVFEFISAVCVEQTDVFKASFYALKGFFYKLSRFMLPCAVSYNFPVKQVNKHTDIIPAYPHSYIWFP